MGRTAEKEVVRENLFLDFLNCSCHKKKLVRFAHNWNDGILENWNIVFWETGKLGYGKIPFDGN